MSEIRQFLKDWYDIRMIIKPAKISKEPFRKILKERGYQEAKKAALEALQLRNFL